MGTKNRKGVVSEKTKEFYGQENLTKSINHIKSNVHILTELEFLSGYRLLKTYGERSEILKEKGYTLLENKLNESESYYYITQTINLKSELETWVKRKSFVEIKKQLLKSPDIHLTNPYEKFIVNDDNGNPHTFYKKN